MKLYFLIFSILYLYCVRGEGFFSKLMTRGRSDITRSNDDYDVCETVKVMPRIAMAVVGGSPLKAENSAPYIAAVGEKLRNGSISWFCGGSLISPQDILTAAHCLISRNVTTIRVGSFSTRKKPTENDYEIRDTIIHPDYKITESYNDIAIIKVKDKISFSRNIKPICLPENDREKYEKEKAKVIGWGAEEFGGEGSQKLQQVEVDVFTNAQCEKAYCNSTIAPKNFPRGIIREQLCAGSPKGGKDACQGDSGGPLVLTDENGIVRQIGIVSTGAGCGFKMYPGVYVRVSSYTDWIKKQVKSSSQSSTNTNQQSNPQNPQRDQNGNSKPKQETTTMRPNQNKKNLNNGPSRIRNEYISRDENFQNEKTGINNGNSNGTFSRRQIINSNEEKLGKGLSENRFSAPETQVYSRIDERTKGP